MINKITDDKYVVLIICFLWSKYILYTKISFNFFFYNHVHNDFFPTLLYLINPFYLDLILICCVVLHRKVYCGLGVVCSFIQIIHPESFGIQNYVVSFYVFIWLLVDRLNIKGSEVFFGRLIVSFVFAGAFIGKLTPGWINGAHPAEFLTHIHNITNVPSSYVLGEFAVVISFLLPFRFGILVPIAVICGMIASISFGIFPAVGPIVGLLLTLVVLKNHNSTNLTVFFDRNCGICMKVYRVFSFLNSRYLTLSYLQESEGQVDKDKSFIFIASKSAAGNYYGYDTYCEVFSRIPILSLLCPFLRLKFVTKIGRIVYLKVANNRTCKIP